MLRPLISIFAGLSLVTGLAYPALIAGIAQTAWPHQANGSVLAVDGKPVGSALIGQNFTRPDQLWSRPSATADKPYNTLASGGSNLGANNPALLDAVHERSVVLRASDPANKRPIPVDLLTASASGLDPEISLAGALWQAPRIARARGLGEAAVRELIDKLATLPTLGLWGEARVNVLAVNLALDGKTALAIP